MTIDTALRATIAKAEADTDTNPTDSQKESGNYRKGRFALHGMQVVIENPKGSIRSGTDADGKEWSVTMPATYGYIARTEGADGDQLDVYIGPEPEIWTVYVIDQVDADTKAFDEHKVMLGYGTEGAALADYDAAFSDGRGHDRRGAVTPLPFLVFRLWVKHGEAGKPVGASEVIVEMVGDAREITTDGLLRAGAVLTRAGPIDYSRSELGLDGEGRITVHRTIETLRHPDTFATLRGAPITLGHPDGGKVTPDNFKDVVVGAVSGEPRADSNSLIGDVLIGDKEALQRLDEGVDELSIGYDFLLDPKSGETVGPLIVNHVAIVPQGRAGSAVRVLDELKEDDMAELSKQDIQDAIAAGCDAFMKKNKMDGQTGIDMAAAVGDAMKPFMDGMKKTMDALDEAKKVETDRIAAQDAAENKRKAEEAKNALVKQVTDDVQGKERTRYAIMTDALPLIPEDKRSGLEAMEPKDILVLAVGDAVPDAANQPVDYLRGVVNVMSKQLQAAGTGRPATYPPA